MGNLSPATLTRRRRKGLSSLRILVSRISRGCQRLAISTVGLHRQSHQERERAHFPRRCISQLIHAVLSEWATRGSGGHGLIGSAGDKSRHRNSTLRYLCDGIKGATGWSQLKVRHDVEMEQPLDGQWLIENGLKPWGEASRCAARWSCEQDVLGDAPIQLSDVSI